MKNSVRISAGKCFTGGQIVIKNAKVPAGSTTDWVSAIFISRPHARAFIPIHACAYLYTQQ